MKTVAEDKKLLHELDFFYQDDLNLYFNFKRNIDAAYIKKLSDDSERNFLKRNTKDYLLFTPKKDYYSTFLDYCHISTVAGTPYLFIHKEGRIASIYCENSEGIITHRKHVFDMNEIYDIYYSFEKHLWKYKPRQVIAPCITAVPDLTVVHKAVAV
ncbi:MAG: hypothetical protein RR764_10180 [Oscillospiraceae bacterium]